MDRAILILGEAGAGKTTLMLQLTQELLKVAESDEDQPFPVVCYLSPWPTSQPRGGRAGRERPVEQQPSLQEWIISQLKDEYKVPPRVASSWLETRSLVLLFDGLNEVVEPYRKQCVDSINEFVSEYDSTPVVVLCRSEDYATLAVRLDLHAVTIDPLSRELVSRYLRDGGPPLSGVYTALKEDEDLWELIETPLFFSIFLKTFSGVTASEIKLKGDIPDRRKQLFDKYIQRMLHDHLRAKESNYHAFRRFGGFRGSQSLCGSISLNLKACSRSGCRGIKRSR